MADNFDPDKYLEEVEREDQAEFDPDIYLTEAEPIEKQAPISMKDEILKMAMGPAGLTMKALELAGKSLKQEDDAIPSKTEAAVTGASQGLLMDFADELIGAGTSPIGATKQTLSQLGVDISEDDPELKRYKEARDIARERFTRAEEEHPGTYLAGDIAGGIAPALLTGGASAIAKGGQVAAKRMAKEISKEAAEEAMGQAMRQGLKAGAVQGGVTGVGLSEEEEFQGLMGDALIASGMGAGMGYMVPVAGKKAKGAVNWLRDKFETIDTAIEAGVRTSRGETIVGQEAGREIWQNLKAGVENMGDLVNAIRKRVKTRFDDLYKAADDKGVLVDPTMPLDSLKVQVLDHMKRRGGIQSKENLDSLVKQIEKMETYVGKEGPMPISMLNEYKGDFWNEYQRLMKADDPLSAKQALNAYNSIRDLIKTSLREADPKLGDTYESVMKEYAKLKKAMKEIDPKFEDPDEITQAHVSDRVGQLISKLQEDSKSAEKARDITDRIFNRLTELDPVKAPMLKEEILDAAKRYDVNRQTKKGGIFIFGGLEGVGARLGAAAGSTARGIKQAPKAGPKYVAKQLRTMTNIDIDRYVGKIKEKYPSESGKRLSNILERIADSKDANYRSALFFSATQNPAYREILREVAPEYFDRKKEE